MKTLSKKALCILAFLPLTAAANATSTAGSVLVASPTGSAAVGFAHPEAFSSLQATPSDFAFQHVGFASPASLSAPGATQAGAAGPMQASFTELAERSIYATGEQNGLMPASMDYEVMQASSEPKNIVMLLTGLCLLAFMTYRRLS